MASWAQRTVNRMTDNMRESKAKLAEVCQGCDPDAVAAFLEASIAMFHESDQCPVCNYSIRVEHTHDSDCTFAAVLASRGKGAS